jgi:O-antigen/teichoic acid export membrane protein
MVKAKSISFLNAVKWAYSANWGEKAFSSLFTFVLAALLGPRDFGVISLAMIYIAFVQMLLSQGIVAALIQRKDLDDHHLNTVFWTNLGISVSLALLSITLAGWWARANHLPELSSIIAALSVCIPIEGLALVQLAILQREMDFKSLAIRTNASVLLGGVVGLGMAFTGFGVWALVGQQIVRDVAALVLLWWMSNWRPRLEFHWSRLRGLLRFSFSNFAAQLAIFFEGQSGAVLMGILFGPVAVGLYRLAERLVSSVSAITTTSIQSVSLPEFSRLQDKPEQLSSSVLTCVRLAAIVTLPAMAGMLAVSGNLVATLGTKWLASVGVLRILSLLGMFMMFSIFTGPLLQALSKPHRLALLEWVRALISIGLLFVAGLLVKNADVGVQITAIALARFAMGAVLVTPVYLYLLMRLGRVSFGELVTAIAPSGLAAIAVLASVYSFNLVYTLPERTPALALAIRVVLGGSAGAAVLLALDSALRTAIVSMLRRRLGARALSKGIA